MSNNGEIIGRTKTAVVFGQGDSAKAAVISINARVFSSTNTTSVTFRGPVEFEPSVVEHISEIILPGVERITGALGLEPLSFEIEAVNLGAVSATGIKLAIAGFSADAAIMLAMLSAAIKIPLLQDFLITGHIASSEGDIRIDRKSVV